MIQDIKNKFAVTKRWNNGYRCSCCHSSWLSDPEFFDSLEEAIQKFPVFIPSRVGFDGSDIEYCFITDPDGAIVAEGALTWIGNKAERYHNSRWSGHILNHWFNVTEGTLYEKETHSA